MFYKENSTEHSTLAACPWDAFAKLGGVASVGVKHCAFKCYIYSANLSLLNKESHLNLGGTSLGGIATFQSTAVLNGSLRGSEMCL